MMDSQLAHWLDVYKRQLQAVAADLVDADKTHSSTASNSTRSIPISQTEDAT